MAQLIVAGAARNEREAARVVAPFATGPTTSLRAKRYRLVRQYRERAHWLLAAARMQLRRDRARQPRAGLVAAGDQLAETFGYFDQMQRGIERAELMCRVARINVLKSRN
jgi:hypothetical protein